MKIRELFANIEHELIRGDADAEIAGIRIDSRLADRGDMFVAVVGAKADGHDHIGEAVARGVAAVLTCKDISASSIDGSPGVAIIRVADTREILSALVNEFHGRPSERFRLIGVTGTNGKTSVSAMIDGILRFAGHKTGLLGTIDNYCGGKALSVRRTTPTTPDCVELGEIMSQMAKEGADDLIMEVSSMGLKTGRVNALTFDVGVFTNISPEHLDDHGTMDDYRASKLRLFSLSDHAVINADDPFSLAIEENARGDVLRYGIENRKESVLCAENISYEGDTVSFDMTYDREKDGSGADRGRSTSGVSVRAERIALDTPSRFAVYNALAAMGAALRSGVDFSLAAAALREGVRIAGRFEIIRGPDGVTAIVDYAHTAEALKNLLMSVRANPSYARVVSVFGCGGDRDRGKREPMGRISGDLADFTIITSDNPRTEDPLEIIRAIESGARASGGEFATEPDRRKAIERAAASASAGTVIVVSGKGHEDYQILGDRKIHFDDREIVREAFDRRGGISGA
ncbi:MAG: UDP-N-acetylmuramoyl-L-alanyl-D-glutamate--2,6-diaminopimelate ligase [Clostridiales Family XIII bacterium]|jgi:UDP-N-acetylmuramoyl-L-alanyl-D-glutamate--2,6-diaminopimelate ligase|nr:UDP-N-acetylmuramoyl-L-alanyl-D-glutamate--2,6-diaminopimelate ligase [Clostridiales Family XIII bacterium]